MRKMVQFQACLWILEEPRSYPGHPFWKSESRECHGLHWYWIWKMVFIGLHHCIQDKWWIHVAHHDSMILRTSYSHHFLKDHSERSQCPTYWKFGCWSSLQCDRKTDVCFDEFMAWSGASPEAKTQGPHPARCFGVLDNRENKKYCRTNSIIGISYDLIIYESLHLLNIFDKTPQGWAYRTNSQHFATTSDGWMEATDSKTRWFTLRWYGITTTLLISSTICLREKKTYPSLCNPYCVAIHAL